MSRCELCALVPTTHWYCVVAEPFPFTVLDCDSCEVPMAVLGEHRAWVRPEERQHLEQVLAAIAAQRFPHGWYFDDHMRQIPEHYHIHVRPYPAWYARRGENPAEGK